MSPPIVLWLSAHPEPRPLNGSLRRAGIAHVKAAGHPVLDPDLYAMEWNPVLSRADAGVSDTERFQVTSDVRRAALEHRLPEDEAAEQEKLRQADAVVV